MNPKSLLVSLLAGIGVATAAAPAPDSRFDGIWVGTETVMGYEMHGTLKSSEKISHDTPAKIVIAQNGTLLGVLEGYGTGRYNDVKRVGNTIVFQAGIRNGELRLSPDGQTLLERGHVPSFFIIGTGGTDGALNGHRAVIPTSQYLQSNKSTAEVTGKFHRSSK